MKIKKAPALALAFFLACLLPAFSSWAYWVWSPETGKFVNPEGAVQDTAEEQYDYAMQFYKEKNFEEAAKQLHALLKKFPGARIAPEAQYRLGTLYEERNDFLKAYQAYKVLIESYPQSDRLNEAIEREFRIGNLFLSGKKAKFMGLEILPSLPRAAEIFQHIVKNAPYSDFGDKAQFRLGLTYKKWAHYEEAVEAFQDLIDQYPKSELVPDARYQLAETSFEKSAAANRDQRAMDDAMGQIDHFLTRHGQSGETSEKAAKLRQEIDEKNAEKNYRIGLYYEKENYVSSALIYYGDIARRYPHTKWGEKANVKLQSLKQPADYLSAQEKEIAGETTTLEAQLKGLPEGADPLERDRLKRQLERLKQRGKSLEKNKGETLKRRREDIKRRERELKDKFKKLQSKKKLLKKNPSEDFKRAIERWNASLESEQDSLTEEKKQVKDWSQELGLKQKDFGLEMLPFLGEPSSELEKIRRVEAKKLYKVSGEKKTLLEEKEVLYKQYGEVTALLEDMGAKRPLQSTDLKSGPRQGQLQATRGEIKRLEEELGEKRALYEKRFGVPTWLNWVKVPGKIVARSTTEVVDKSLNTLSVLNPFDSGDETLEDKNLEELLERRMHLKEKIAATRSLTETLNQAFDAELALQEQKRLLASLEEAEKADPRELRKAVKHLERDIRSRYEEIEDRHEHKKRMLEELDQLLKKEIAEEPGASGAVRRAASPVLGFARLTKAFFVGLPHEELELTQGAEALAADSASTDRAKKLKEEIELESLLIEAKSREIVNLQKELEILKAKASLAGGFKFRSAIVKVPYLFIGEAIENANRLVPKKNRQEMLINRLDKETRELESLKAELIKVEEVIEKQSPPSAMTAAPPSATTAKEEPKPEIPAESKEVSPPSDEPALRSEIQEIAKNLETRENAYEREKAVLETELDAISRESGKGKREKDRTREEKEIGGRESKLRKELDEIEEELMKLIVKESDLEKEESQILEKRIQKIDTVIPKVRSKALSQDLMTERQHMEDRLLQLESRRSFLSKELERFQLPETRTGNQ